MFVLLNLELQNMKKVSLFVTRPILNVLVMIERIISLVAPNQKIKIKNAIWQKLNKLVCSCRELRDLQIDAKCGSCLCWAFQLRSSLPVNQVYRTNNSEGEKESRGEDEHKLTGKEGLPVPSLSPSLLIHSGFLIHSPQLQLHRKCQFSFCACFCRAQT